MTQMRFTLNEEATRVLDTIKGKYGLKNRDAAFAQLIKTHADEYIEPVFDEKVLRELDEIYARKDHVKMNMKQLKKHLGLD